MIPTWTYDWIGFWTYWVPVLVALCGNGINLYDNIRHDLKERNSYYYTPRATVGKALWYFIVCFIPLVNVMFAFRGAWKVCDLVSDMLGKVFDIPLIPAKKKVD